MLDFGSIRQYRRAVQHGLVLLFLVGVNSIPAIADDARTCTCPDGRQFSIGASLFGKNSARITITGFTEDPFKSFQTGQLPVCRDLILLGQVIRLKDVAGRPFLKREGLRRGTIADACETKIQFSESKKSYDFFTDDGNAITLSDVDDGQTTPVETEADQSSPAEDQEPSDLTGKDLIRLIPREPPASDPGGSGFGADDLKEGAYFVVPKRIKAFPAADDGGVAAPALVPVNREVSIWAGTLGRIQKNAGFRAGPLWQVELLPRSGTPPITKLLVSLPADIRRRSPVPNRFVLPSSAIIEINRYLDQRAAEWTRFGEESQDARARDALGTTILPDIYVPPPPTLDENIENAQKAETFQAMRATAHELVFVPRNPKALYGAGTLVLDEETRWDSNTPASADLFRRQCFVESDRTPSAPELRVTDFDVRVFRPRSSAQVSDDYYAIDLAFQLSSGPAADMRLVCRFPSAAIDPNLLEKAKRVLSSHFDIRRFDNQRQAMR